MLADGIEAAARTLSDPSFDRIQGMVQKMINKVFSSGELNECELTLRDLHLIAKCFTRVLSGIYHQRIAYAEPAEKVNEAASEEAENPNRRDRRVENLKRLGVE
jgi:membrane-associated HD superfamily phosphohydrolase